MMLAESPVGVFDSGVGGLSVLRALRRVLPQERFVYFADTAHAPYGERDAPAIAARTLLVARGLVLDQGIKALVVACNTATAAAIAAVRGAWPTLPVVGVEPALRPAAMATRTGHVAVLATRTTVQSERFAGLLEALRAPDRFFHVVACDGLAAAIEQGDREGTNRLCESYLGAAGRFGSGPGEIDTVVLGCTHYPFAESALRAAAGHDVQFIETGEAVARQTARLLEQAGLRGHQGGAEVALRGSGDPEALAAAAERWL